MNGKHTPGPWRIENETNPYAEKGFKIFSGQGLTMERVAFVPPVVIGSSEPNARLIAAAPELFTVAIRAFHLIHSGGELDGITREGILEELKAAIAKAEGK